MGDAILAGAALSRLRQHLPHSRITLLACPTVAAVLAHNPWNDDWIVYNGAEAQNFGSWFLPLVFNREHSAPGPSQKQGELHRTLARNLLYGRAQKLRTRNFDAVILLPNSFRSALLTFRAGIKIRIGYARDGRACLLTHPVSPFRLPGRYAPVSMRAYYGHLIDSALRLFGVGSGKDHDYQMELFAKEKDQQQVDKFFSRWQISEKENLVIMVPGGAFGPSKWWPAERFAQLADRLIRQDHCRVILCCAPNDAEREIARKITAAAQHALFDLSQENLSLGALKELIRRCRLMVANDTGPCHIAAAFKVPLVTFFGPTDPRWTATGYDKEIRLRVEVDCGPCQQKTCAPGHHRCLRGISVEDAYAAARKLLNLCEPPVGVNNTVNEVNNETENFIYGGWYEPYAENYVPFFDGSGLVHSGYKDILAQAGLATGAEVFAYAKGRRLDKPGLGGSRERIRIELSGENHQHVAIYLKRYQNPGTVELIKRLLTRRSRLGAGCYDFASALLLAENGIPVARPIAYGQECRRLGEKRSFVMIEELPHADALERLLPRRQEAKKDYRLLRDKKALIKEIAALVRRLHGAGLFHRDLYLAHIFLSKDRAGRERLCLIDLQRVFRPVVGKGRWRVKDLGQLYYSARSYFSRADTMRFLYSYLQTDRLSSKDKSLARAVYRKAERIARHDEKRKRRFARF